MRALVVFVVLSIAPSRIRADVLPTLVIQADTAGKGTKLKAGFDARLGTIPFPWIVSPFLQATTDAGLATLLSIDSDGPSASSAWEAGAVLTHLRWHERRPTAADVAATAGTAPEYKALAREQYAVCRSKCRTDATEGFCGEHKKNRQNLEKALHARQRALEPFDPLWDALHKAKEARRQASAARAAGGESAATLESMATWAEQQEVLQFDVALAELISSNLYCAEAKRVLQSYLAANYDPWIEVPDTSISVGVSAGATVHDFLEPRGTTATDERETHASLSVAAMLVKHWRGVTLELPMIARRRFELATSKTARWCVPETIVDANDDGEIEDDVDVGAERCTERALGPLHPRIDVQLGVFLGGYSPRRFWRLAAGPVVSIGSARDDEKRRYQVGFVVPLYVGTELLKKDLKTLARFSVGVFRTRGREQDSKPVNSISFTLAVLGSSTLFASPFDQF